MSMRKSAVMSSQLVRPGRAVKSLWDICRWDGGRRSRHAAHATKKDDKNFRKPWQRNPRTFNRLVEQAKEEW